MCLRSGRILEEMLNLKNTSRVQNDASDPEPPVTMTIGTAGTINHVRVAGSILTPVVTSTIIPRLVVSLPPVTNIPTTLRPTSNFVGDLTPLMFQVLPYI